jgi:hypothetical protein
MWSFWTSLEKVSWVSWAARFLTVFFGAIAFFAGSRESNLSRLKRDNDKQESDQKLASTQKEAAQANERAALANERAAKADEKTEAERLRRTLLEASFEPRRIDPKADSWMTLRMFSGTKVLIEALGMESEVQMLSSELAFHLQGVGWIVKRGTLLGVGIGVTILTQDTPKGVTAKSKDAATILSFFLKDCGIEANASSAKPAEGEVEPDMVVVRVGAKRQWYFDSNRTSKDWDALVKMHDIPEGAPPDLRKSMEEAKQRIEHSRMHALADPEQNRQAGLQYDPNEKATILKKYTPRR